MTDRFTDACRINETEPGAFSWDVPAGWLQGRGAWGGLVIAASVNAVEVTQQQSADRRVRSVTAHMFGPLPAGTARIDVAPLRVGSAMTTWKASVTGSDGSAAAHSVIITGTPRWEHRRAVGHGINAGPPRLACGSERSGGSSDGSGVRFTHRLPTCLGCTRLGRYSPCPRMGIARSRPGRQCRAMDSRNDFGAGGCVVAGQLRGHDRIASDGHGVFQCAPACSASDTRSPATPGIRIMGVVNGGGVHLGNAAAVVTGRSTCRRESPINRRDQVENAPPTLR